MMGIPSEFAPSSLLQYEQVPLVVRTLLENSRVSRRDYEWEQAERYALDVRDACQHPGSQVGLAAAQLHLADVYRQVGELGKAMDLCKQAYRIFNGQPAEVQRHNEAVAAYAQGLLHALCPFSDDIQILHWYREALTLFKEAQELWAKRNDQPRFKICKDIRSYIEKREKQIVDIHVSGQVRPDTLDVLHLDSVETPFARDLQGHVLDDSHVEIDEVTYCLHSGTLPSSDVEDARYCFVLPVRERLRTFPTAQDSDYVVVRLHWWLDKERIEELDNVWMPGVVWSPGDGWDMGDFTVTPDGRIWFHSCAMKTRIVGGEDTGGAGGEVKDPTGAIKGYIIGLLKPDTAPSSRPSAASDFSTSSEPSQPPLSESPIASSPGEPDKTERDNIPRGPEDDKAQDGRDSRAMSPTQIEVLDPVWLFSDDLDVLDRLLEPSGKVEISTDKVPLERHTQVLENLPVGWLHMSVPKIEISIMIRPRQVEVRWPHKWDRPDTEADVVSRIREFVTSRRHPLYFLGKRGWQLGVTFCAFGLLLPMILFYLLFEGASDILHALGILGILMGAILGVLAFVGRYVPSGSHVTLWKWTREKFSRRVQKIAYYIARVGSIFALGVLVGSRRQADGWEWLTILGLVAAVSTVTWLFGFSVRRGEH